MGSFLNTPSRIAIVAISITIWPAYSSPAMVFRGIIEESAFLLRRSPSLLSPHRPQNFSLNQDSAMFSPINGKRMLFQLPPTRPPYKKNLYPFVWTALLTTGAITSQWKWAKSGQSEVEISERFREKDEVDLFLHYFEGHLLREL